MLQNPHYSSHAEQQAALGSAAKLDPEKHPRRYKLHQAREKFRPTKRCHQPSSEERTPALLERAEALAHLGLTEAARELGVSRSVLDRLRADYGIEFAKPARRNGAGRVKALAGSNPTMKELAAAAGLTYNHTYKLCKEYGIEPGVPYGQDPA